MALNTWQFYNESRKTSSAGGTINSANDSVPVDLQGLGCVSVQISGTWAGTIMFEVSNDGSTWNGCVLLPSSSSTAITETTANGLWQGSVGGCAVFRVRFSNYVSGAATVWMSAGLTGIRLVSSGGGGGGGTVDQGAAGAQAWKVDGSAVTQPVSGTVAVSNFPATQPVSGTFWQATQPVSGTVAVSNLPATQPVSGTFWQATQPVSGTVAVSNFPATQPVSGTFWQATQPVSGTFWQATQPVSGTVAVSNFPASQAVTGTFWQATQPISGAVTQAFKAGAAMLNPNYAANHITSKTTTNVTAATAYVASIAICVTGAGSSWSLNIKDKSGTPLALYTAASVVLGNTYIAFHSPILCTNGIDIITAGTTAGTMDVFVTYYQ